jgi:hypothetical protein
MKNDMFHSALLPVYILVSIQQLIMDLLLAIVQLHYQGGQMAFLTGLIKDMSI